MYSAKILIKKGSDTSYKRIIGSIKEHSRSKISIKETAKELQINIETDDITALRASINTVIRDIQVIDAASMAGFHKTGKSENI